VLPALLRLAAALGSAGADKMSAIYAAQGEGKEHPMDTQPIRTEADYDAALKEIELYFDREPEPGSPESVRFDVLAALVAAYEREHWPIDPPDPMEAIRYCMERQGYTQADLATLIGSQSRASEILTRIPRMKRRF
jgi:HTH-type transcriptional regulator/antitoxin HigA